MNARECLEDRGRDERIGDVLVFGGSRVLGEKRLRTLSYTLNPFPFPSLPLRVLPTSSSIIKAIEPTLSSV